MCSKISMRLITAYLILILYCRYLTNASHFRGGWISYIPVADHGTHVTIQFTASWAWRWSSVRGSIGSWVNRGGSIACRVGCGTAWSPSSIGNVDFLATAASSIDDWIQGEKTWTANLPKVPVYRASYTTCCWIRLNSGSGSVEVSVMLDTRNRPDGKINTAPVSSIAALVKLRRGTTTQLTIPWSDADADTVRCRQTIASQNECGGICGLPPGVTLDGNTCTLTFTTSAMPTGWFGISAILEDFFTPSSTSPMSGVVVQFLAFVCGGGSLCPNP
jgi:hypothetical protein